MHLASLRQRTTSNLEVRVFAFDDTRLSNRAIGGNEFAGLGQVVVNAGRVDSLDDGLFAKGHRQRIGDGTEGLSRIHESNSAVVTEHTFEFVDSPNTTNATTYQVGFKSSTTSHPKRFVMNDTPCEMIIMEIAQ